MVAGGQHPGAGAGGQKGRGTPAWFSLEMHLMALWCLKPGEHLPPTSPAPSRIPLAQRKGIFNLKDSQSTEGERGGSKLYMSSEVLKSAPPPPFPLNGCRSGSARTMADCKVGAGGKTCRDACKQRRAPAG